MELEQLHPDAQQMVNRFEQKEDFEALVMVMKLALQSYETCFYGTLNLLLEEFESWDLNPLAQRTVDAFALLNDDSNPDKAEIFEALASENWYVKSTDPHLCLARFSWACLFFLRQKNQMTFESKLRPGEVFHKERFKEKPDHFVKLKGHECNNALVLIKSKDKTWVYHIAVAYTELMKTL